MIHRLIILVFVAIGSISCNEKPMIIKDSAGKMNDILVVVSDELWDNAVGDTIRHTLAAPVDGLVREEPIFTLNQIKPKSFYGMLKKSRNYLKVELSSDKKLGVNVTTDLYANPQKGVVVRANSHHELIQYIQDNADQIIDVFKQHEIQEKQNLIDEVSLNTSRIKERLGIEIKVPQAYKYAAVNDPDFFWLRRNIREGTMDLMLYEVPRHAIPQDDNVVASITRVRDSVGGMKIPVTEGGLFQTEPAFSPFVNETQINGVFAYETKGLWEVKNMFMSGPFLNYAIYNKKKDNWIVVEGYIYAPSAVHRNYLFEIESILKSLTIVE